MTYIIVKTLLSALIIVAVSEIARRNADLGALVASLPLISVIGMIWLWRDTADPVRMADHAQATFWYVLPSLPMFLLIPWLLRGGMNFWLALLLGCLLTMLLYVAMTAMLARWGVRL
jgi:accessory gene regulator protein AgrB